MIKSLYHSGGGGSSLPTGRGHGGRVQFKGGQGGEGGLGGGLRGHGHGVVGGEVGGDQRGHVGDAVVASGLRHSKLIHDY